MTNSTNSTGKVFKLTAAGSIRKALGEEVEVSDDVVAVYAERRYDSFGPYTKLMCVRLVDEGVA